MQQFEEDDPMELQATGAQHDVSYPVRAEGNFIVPMIPWPRIPEQEERDIAGVQKRKPYVHKRQGNCWDKYGESSSATCSWKRVPEWEGSKWPTPTRGTLVLSMILIKNGTCEA